jgi:SAM-dependent methyltransferase
LSKTDAFTEKVLADTSAAAVTILATLGDRLGLFRALADREPATPARLAARAGLQERYTREWLAAMFSAGYLEHDPVTGCFVLPSDRVPALSPEGEFAFLGGLREMLTGAVGVLDLLAAAFQNGTGVGQGAYAGCVWDGMERFTAFWFDNLLVPQWIAAMPDVRTMLERGADVADVGCGRGRAVIRLARAYPDSRLVGYDLFARAVARGTENARWAGVWDRVRFETRDASQGLAGRFDIVTSFDSIHEAPDPRGTLRAIREALRPGGIYVCLEADCADRLEENAGPCGALLYAWSLLYCLTTSLARGGEGLGAAGLPEPKLRELCAEAGFSKVRRVLSARPFHTLYEIQL